MKEASSVFVSMTQRWNFKVHEVAQNSFRHAHHLLRCISDRNHKRSIQEVSLIAQDAENEFRKLLTLLDGSMSSDCRRIKKGPLPKSHDINPAKLMDSPNSSPQDFTCNSNQTCIVRELFLQSNKSPTALIQGDNFSLCRHKQNQELQQRYSQTNIVANKSITVQSQFSEHSTSLISMDGSSIDKQTIRFSSSETLASPDESSMLSYKRKCEVKSGDSTTCVVSTGGCHCSKQRWILAWIPCIWISTASHFFFLLHVTCLERKLRIKRAITVPALSNKLADIPPDDYSWRKYGQKPIKGSPHPRYVHVSYSFLSLNQIFFSACKSYWSGMYWLIPSTLQHYV